MTNELMIIIDDDPEDIALIRDIVLLLRFPGTIMLFTDSIKALDFLMNTTIQPQFIICDINMPKLDGFELRQALLDTESAIKDVPFLFFSTSKSEGEMVLARGLNVKAYYQKSNTYEGMKETFGNILSLLNITPES